MATDATGTPTAKGIPKYNPDGDAPSGLGFNAAMDSIDAILDGFASKPSGIVSGEVPVWNGSAWVRSSVTRINTVRPQDLGQDSATTGQVLAWNGSIWAPAVGGGVVVQDRVATSLDVTNSSAETTFYSYTVPANLLSTNKKLRLTIMGNYIETVAGSMTWRFKFGATTWLTHSAFDATDDPDRRSLKIVYELMNRGATNVQDTQALVRLGDAVGAGVASGVFSQNQHFGELAEDTTADKTLSITVQWSTAALGLSVVRRNAVLELL